VPVSLQAVLRLVEVVRQEWVAVLVLVGEAVRRWVVAGRRWVVAGRQEVVLERVAARVVAVLVARRARGGRILDV